MQTKTGLKQFRSEGCQTYLIWERASRSAFVIDPVVELMDAMREYIAEGGLRVTHALDTHTHADHYSGSHLFKEQWGSRIGMSQHTRSKRADLLLKQGDSLPLGSLVMKVLETPGHTPDSICLAAEGLLFTGDTLLIGSTGRTDFPGSDPTQQFHSLHEVLGELPDSTLVLPGHDYNQLLCSTLGTERTRNPHLLIKDGAEFARMKRDELLCAPGNDMKSQIDYNLAPSPAPHAPDFREAGRMACGKAMNQDPRFAAINVEKYRTKLEEHDSSFLFLDVRDPSEYREGHIPGVTNLPLSEIPLRLSEIRRASRIYVSCLSGGRSGIAAKTLSYLGVADVVNVSGGFQAWQQAGLLVEK